MRMPAAQGGRWFLDGFRFFRANKLILGLWLCCYFSLLLMVASFPLVGPFLVLVFEPVLSLGLMEGCRALTRDARPPFGTLFQGFRGNMGTLLAIGAVHLTLLMLGATLFVLLEGETLKTLMEAPEGTQVDIPLRLVAEVQGLLVLYLPVHMTYRFAQMLAAWQGLSAGKALFFSVVAALRNARPLFAFGLVVVASSMTANLVGLSLVSLVSPILAAPLSLVISVTLTASLTAAAYLAYLDVFALGDEFPNRVNPEPGLPGDGPDHD